MSPLHHPDGWRVRVRNGRVVARSARRLEVAHRDPKRPVVVRITSR